MARGAAALVVALISFVIGLDDDNGAIAGGQPSASHSRALPDYARLYHSAWHFFVGVAAYFLFTATVPRVKAIHHIL